MEITYGLIKTKMTAFETKQTENRTYRQYISTLTTLWTDIYWLPGCKFNSQPIK